MLVSVLAVLPLLVALNAKLPLSAQLLLTDTILLKTFKEKLLVQLPPVIQAVLLVWKESPV